MSETEQMKSSAVQVVTNLLTQRLARSKVLTSRPDFYLHCEADEPRNYSGGVEVRVHVWRLWSLARVEIDAESGALMSWAVPGYAEPENEMELTKEEALADVAKAIELPLGAELQSFYHHPYAVGRKIARLQWRHMHQGLRVDGDYLSVVIHPQTKRIIEWACKWRVVRLAH
jgi:hypothetical protein